MGYLILTAFLGVVLFTKAYLTMQQNTAIYKPSNLFSVILFLSTFLVTGIFWIIDWVMAQCLIFLFAFKSRVTNLFNRDMNVVPLLKFGQKIKSFINPDKPIKI
jgi:hypothetical protein